MEKVTRVWLEPLKSKKQLRQLEDKKICDHGFDADNRTFLIKFSGNNKMQELAVSFQTRTPRLYISKEYENVKSGNPKLQQPQKPQGASNRGNETFSNKKKGSNPNERTNRT